MAKFCRSCGLPLAEGIAFCNGCGTAVEGTASPAPPAAAAAKAGSPVLKIVLAGLAILFVLGVLAAAGLIYTGYRVKKSVEASARSKGIDLSALASGEKGRRLDPCSLLRDEEATQILGVTIGRTERQESKCNYFAQPVSEEQRKEQVQAAMEAVKARAGSRQPAATESADPKELMRQTGIGDLAKSIAAGANNGTGPYLTIEVNESGKATMAAMKLAMGAIGGSKTTESLAGVGDDAILGPADSMLIFVKNGTSVEIDLRQVPQGRERGIAMAKRILPRM